MRKACWRFRTGPGLASRSISMLCAATQARRTDMKYRYEEFTWPEIREAVAGKRVAILPVGTVEQHGPHLPLVTDVLTATEMSRLAVERDRSKAVLMPPVYYS